LTAVKYAVGISLVQIEMLMLIHFYST